MIIAVDPGTTQSAYIVMDGYEIITHGIVPNEQLRGLLLNNYHHHLVIEMIASYGMAVGKEVFDTCVWIGRFIECAPSHDTIYRKDVKLDLCGTTRAKDANIRQALIDRYGKVKGISKDKWAALAVGTVWTDRKEKE